MLGRIIINITLALALGGAGGFLLAQDALFLPAKAPPAAGTLFAGWSLWSLSLSLFALAGFAALAARDWWAERTHQARLAPRLSRWLRYSLTLVLAGSALVLAFAMAEEFQEPSIERPGLPALVT
jgi:cbb3-type cytochrome oxidase subunit 1